MKEEKNLERLSTEATERVLEQPCIFKIDCVNPKENCTVEYSMTCVLARSYRRHGSDADYLGV